MIALTIFPLPVLASPGNISAYRPLTQDYSIYESRMLNSGRNVIKESSHSIGRTSAIRAARLYNESELPKATSWKSTKALQERFEMIRDLRFLTLAHAPDFPRRISWLYPKDGCYARASMMNRKAFRMFVPIPKKVFAFGNLKVETPNAVRGVVGWWYHVAPVVEVQGKKFVLDPSIEYSRPLPLREWLDRMGNPEKIKVAICNTGTYSPGDDCSKRTDGMELSAEYTQKQYLKLEEWELKRLGREPESELGENPPWR